MNNLYKSSSTGVGLIPNRRQAINYVDCTAAPPSENEGDRYILDDTGGSVHANWDGASKLDVVTFRDGTWYAETPVKGWSVYLTTPNYELKYDGTGWIPNWDAYAINAASAKTTPVSADKLALLDSAASYSLKTLSYSDLLTTLQTYFDGRYVIVS